MIRKTVRRRKTVWRYAYRKSIRCILPPTALRHLTVLRIWLNPPAPHSRAPGTLFFNLPP
jgi:hypothetical protein